MRRPPGELRPSRRAVFAHLERFDGVVFLTERQRSDAAALLSDPGNLFVVPNGIDAPASPALDRDRDPAAGVVVAQLTRRKRVDHALDIVRGADDSALRSRSRSSATGRMPRASAQGGRRRAHRRRHVRRPSRDAAEAFGAASWTLLTSTSEGAPLVLAEAMSRGCLPVAYDIPYGPADLIVDGVDGLLVPDGDRDAAAQPSPGSSPWRPRSASACASAARATAARHDDRRSSPSGGGCCAPPPAARPTRLPRVDATVERLRLRFRGGRLRVSATLRGVPRDAGVVLSVQRGGRGPLVRTRRAGRDGRIVWRLDEPATRFVGARHPLTCVVAVELGDTAVELAATTVHPDTRSLPRRRRAAPHPAEIVTSLTDVTSRPASASCTACFVLPHASRG